MLRQGKPGQAARLFEQILQTHPDHADALHYLGLARHMRGEFATAYDPLKRSTLLAPNSAPYHNNFGETCRKLGRPEEALAAFRHACALQPGFPHSTLNLASTLQELGRNGEAIECLGRALSLTPESPALRWALGLAQAGQHDFDLALHTIEQGLTRTPTDLTLLDAKGAILKRSGKLNAAANHYRAALCLHPHSTVLLNNQALILLGLHDAAGAAACFEHLLALEPDNHSAAHQLAALRGITTDRAPVSYVRELFDGYADGFDLHLTQQLGYQSPHLLATMLRAHSTARHSILDLGCGTGLFGAEIGEQKIRLTGIDLSPRMLAKARERHTYDILVEGDIPPYLKALPPGEYDLIVAADVFIYLGNLEPVFLQAQRLLPPGGLLLFTIETCGDCPAGQGHQLKASGRYQHSVQHTEQLAAQSGFHVIDRQETTLRQESNTGVPGLLYLLERASPSGSA